MILGPLSYWDFQEMCPRPVIKGRNLQHITAEYAWLALDARGDFSFC